MPGCPYLSAKPEISWAIDTSQPQLPSVLLSGADLPAEEAEIETAPEADAVPEAEVDPSALEISDAEAALDGGDKIYQSKKPCKVIKKTETIKKPGETIIHKPSHIIVNQPPTRLIINHPPLIVKPSPVILHHGGKIIHKHVAHKFLPRPVQVRPVYVKVVKPIEKKVLIEKPAAKKPPCEQQIVVKKVPLSPPFPSLTPEQIEQIMAAQKLVPAEELEEQAEQEEQQEEEAEQTIPNLEESFDGEYGVDAEVDAEQSEWQHIAAEPISEAEAEAEAAAKPAPCGCLQ